MKKENLSFSVKFRNHAHKRLKENCDSEGCIDYGEIIMKIVNIKVPKSLIPDLLKELEEIGMGETIHKRKFKIK